MPRIKKNKFGAKPQGKYRSKLEQYCAQALKEQEICFLYEPYAFVLLPEFTYDTSWEKRGKKFCNNPKVRKIRYIPDFVGKNWIIETKGVRTPAFNLKWKLFKDLLTKKNNTYDLFAPSSQKEVKEVLKYIKNDTKYSCKRVPRLTKSQLQYIEKLV